MIKYYVRTTGERTLDESFSQIEYELLVDTEHNARKSFVEQIHDLSNQNEDVVILEDDVILCKDFKKRIEEVISTYPNEVINFFYDPEAYFTTHIHEYFVFNQCVYYPNKVLKQLTGELTKQYNFYPLVDHDVVEGRALKILGIQNVIYRPCLVQHIDKGSLIGNPCCRRRTPYFVDYLE